MKIEQTDKNGTVDRRVVRTRALLQDALVALVPDRGYAATTVEDICEKANVGRSTFYAHYAGKDQLRSATIEAHLHALSRRHASAVEGKSGSLFAFSRPMFEHAHAFRRIHHALLAEGGDTIHDDMRERVRHAVRSELVAKRGQRTDVPVEFAVQLVAGAFLAVLTWWIAADHDLSPTDVDRMFQRMVANGLPAKDGAMVS